MITVRMLSQALSGANITLVAGEDGLDKTIDYLTVQEFPLKSSRIKKNGFIMGTFYAFQNIDQLLKHFRWYAETNVSAIGYHTVFQSDIPAELIDFANQENMPVFYIPNDVPYHYLFEKYNGLVYQETMRIKDQIDSLNKSMMEALLREKEIHFIIQEFGKYLQVPVIYLDPDLRILSLWSDFLSRSDVNEWLEDVKEHYVHVLTTIRFNQKDAEVYLFEKARHLQSVIIIPLKSRLNFFGYLVVGDKSKNMPFFDIVLKNTSTAVMLDAIKRNQIKEFQKTEDIKLFEEIFRNRNTRPLSALNFYFDISKLNYILIAEPKVNKYIKTCYEWLDNQLREVPNRLVWIFDKKVIGILQYIPKSVLKCDSRDFHIGISGKLPDRSVSNIKKLYQQAMISLHFAKYENKAACSWDSVGIQKIIYVITESELLHDYYLEHLQPLIKHDELHDTNLMKTLHVYLDNFFNLKKTGEQLHMHPNSVKYRINKIEEILKVNLYNPSEFMNVWLAIKCYEYNTLKNHGKVLEE
ncbi:helix-turn-helix domain-containing protein [Brevibacillus marinus]|uniref:helix-turn-helix domain-containing protein n=1 Tax=Brevibacillus marinus TaxID=2496837 RepID=UPI000F8330A4|nr:helix-turn-helix domain-containing protein [Brevibacillus marinus]